MSELEGPEHPLIEKVEKNVYGHLAWFLLNEMWRENRVIVPGREAAWQEISRVAERKQSQTKANPAAAQRLLARHAVEGVNSILFKEASGGIEIPLEIDTNVFNPDLTKASRLLLSVMRLTDYEGKRFLDAFSGSGVLGIYAAAVGASVVSYDISAAAVACAQKNALHNEVSQNMDIRQGDHTCLQPEEKFDIIAANPPLLPIQANFSEQPLASAVFDPELRATIDFIELLPNHLAQDGRCYLITSSTFDSTGRDMYTLCEQNGLVAQLVTAAPREHEWYRIHEIRRSNNEHSG